MLDLTAPTSTVSGTFDGATLPALLERCNR
jgi:hypothetical protein